MTPFPTPTKSPAHAEAYRRATVELLHLDVSDPRAWDFPALVEKHLSDVRAEAAECWQEQSGLVFADELEGD